MEEIDSSDSDATVNYGAEPPEIRENNTNAATPVDVDNNDVVEVNIAAVDVELADIQIISSQLSSDDIKPPSKKKR